MVMGTRVVEVEEVCFHSTPPHRAELTEHGQGWGAGLKGHRAGFSGLACPQGGQQLPD